MIELLAIEVKYYCQLMITYCDIGLGILLATRLA
jgi:hypothetical protein